MTKNNHFEKLDTLLRSQAPASGNIDKTTVYLYAGMLAQIEGSIVVVSNLQEGSSRIFTGSFAGRLGLDSYFSENSIWEKEILQLMTVEEQEEKFIAELRFFHYLRQKPKHRRTDYFLVSKLRFMSSIDILHRMYYIYDESMESVLYAICIYSPMIYDISGSSYVVNSVTGIKEELTAAVNDAVISKRERQVLQMIASGMKSIEIGAALNISKNTVSRHRQEILSKLQVRNSIEACRLARSMGLL